MILWRQAPAFRRAIRKGSAVKTIRQLRQAKGWTQLKLANEVGVTPSTIYNWETGRSEPKVTQLREVARIFGVSSDTIELERDPGQVRSDAAAR